MVSLELKAIDQRTLGRSFGVSIVSLLKWVIPALLCLTLQTCPPAKINRTLPPVGRHNIIGSPRSRIIFLVCALQLACFYYFLFCHLIVDGLLGSLTTHGDRGIRRSQVSLVLRISMYYYQHPPTIHGVAVKRKNKMGDGRRDPKGH